ncbi:MAG: class I SAM-dependent methyltransferase [Pseudomonadota bacterium]
MSVQKPVAFSKLRKLPGWLGWADFQILRLLLADQGPSDTSAVAEIGVHHGKSFIALAASSGQRRMCAIDIFGDQHRNLDHSGEGDKARFLDNLKQFGVDQDRLTILENASEDVSPDALKAAVGPVGLFHIDGGHHEKVVTSDLELACAVATEDAIIVIDDVFRPEWPEVSAATFRSTALRAHGFCLFAVGFNKSFFCKTSHLERYRAVLQQDWALQQFFAKPYQMEGHDILVFQTYPLPEWPRGTVLRYYLSTWHPELFLKLRLWAHRLRRVRRRILRKT